jgi:putative membrane protein
MAWVRTATALISFGFTIYKFFQYLHEERSFADGLLGPRGFAVLMITVGLGALVVANIEHWESVQALRARGVSPPRSLAAVVAGLIAILGLAGLVAVLLRL